MTDANGPTFGMRNVLLCSLSSPKCDTQRKVMKEVWPFKLCGIGRIKNLEWEGGKKDFLSSIELLSDTWCIMPLMLEQICHVKKVEFRLYEITPTTRHSYDAGSGNLDLSCSLYT